MSLVAKIDAPRLLNSCPPLSNDSVGRGKTKELVSIPGGSHDAGE